LAFGGDGNLYVSSFGSDQVRRYNGTTGAWIDDFVNGVSQPWGLVGDLYVASHGTNQVFRYDATGTSLGVFASGGGLSGPTDLQFGPDGNLYVSSDNNNRVLRYDVNSGALIDTFVTGGSGGLNGPRGLAFGVDGDLYVASMWNNRVLQYQGPQVNSALLTSESGDVATFAVVLNSQPTQDVTIQIHSNDLTEGTVSPAFLTFTSANWDVPQGVTVTGVDDLIADGDALYTILTGPAVSNDPLYDGIDADNVWVINQDDDVPGITVRQTPDLVTTESGEQAVFSVVLDFALEAGTSVTIPIASSNTAEGTVSVSSLTFDDANLWNVPQLVYVTGQNDFVDDGDIAYSIITGAASSDDPNYDGINPPNVSVTNLDDDTAGITVTPVSGLETTERGGSAVFTVVLDSEPAADVAIELSSNDLTEGTVGPATLTFTPANWNVPQTVTVTGVDDLEDDGDVLFLAMTAAATSSDPNYEGLDAADVALVNLNNEITVDDAVVLSLPVDAGDTFHEAQGLGGFGTGDSPQSLIISAGIDAQPYGLEWPGAIDEPGHRDLSWHEGIAIEDHFADFLGSYIPDVNADSVDGVTTIPYNFADVYGYDAQGKPLHNLITEAQKDRAREIFELLGYYLGVQFYETESLGIQVATGDLIAVGLESGPGEVAGVGGNGLALMDFEDFRTDPGHYGGRWFNVAMHEIMHNLGFGHAYDLPIGTIMGGYEDIENYTSTADSVYPGDNDVVHGRHLYRPESIDIDMYQFDLGEDGVFSAEVFAERMDDSSLLDATLVLYEQYVTFVDGEPVATYRALAQNDDYYSEDSYLEMYLEAGTYYIGVTASGNDMYDANIDDTGIGGVTQGRYDLRLNFTPEGVDPDDPSTFIGDGSTYLVDADNNVRFDGDADGVPGGVYNFWFNVETEANTIYVDNVDKLHEDVDAAGRDGSLEAPYLTIDVALADAEARVAADPDQNLIVRVVGNNYENDDPNDPSSYLDNVPYEVGRDSFGNALDDGTALEVPRSTTLMIDAGALLKLGDRTNLPEGYVSVGSSAEGIDRSEGALQVLGTPDVSVNFTSHFDETLGVDSEPTINTAPEEGDWGGLIFRNDLDYDFIEDYDPSSGLATREVLEVQGIFLNYVAFADVRYGGGEVVIDGQSTVANPIDMTEARPTIVHNTITNSADAAMSADPNSFADTKFENWDGSEPFTADYDRVGPEIHGNKLVAEYAEDPTLPIEVHMNSTNGLFVRIEASDGSAIELEVCARFDDLDIVHVLSETLVISGTPGGPELSAVDTLSDGSALPVRLLDGNRIQTAAASLPGAGGVLDGHTFSIFDGSTKVVFEFELGDGSDVIARGHTPVFFSQDSSANDVALAVRDAINGAHDTQGLDVRVDTVPEGDVVELVLEGPMISTEGLNSLHDAGTLTARTDARLRIDPGLVVKLDGSRIEAEASAQFIAEGRTGSVDGAPGYKVVFTSLEDDRYGAGGTFDTTEDGYDPDDPQRSPRAGDWAGLWFGPASEASIDQAIIAYAGGRSAIEGEGYASFDPVEIQQAHVRVTNTRFEHNTGGSAGGTRNGRGTVQTATIFVRGAQPVIASNDFIDNDGPIVSINANSLISEVVSDWGRTTGGLAAFDAYDDNHGPLVRDNRMTDNGINGIEIRDETLTTESIWDDTDVVHVLRGEIALPNYHHEGGLTLQSSSSESLVVKLSGNDAGFTASGRPLEIDDRIGGSLYIVGMPGYPVVLTSLADDTVGAGFDLDDQPQFDTNGDGAESMPSPGHWRSVRLDRYGNDRNVAIINEEEQAYGAHEDVNGTSQEPQHLGELATEETDGDDNKRLGFEVHGYIRYDDPADADVYSFDATPGTEIWIDVDYTTHALDTVIELIDADGNVLARSDNSVAEEADQDEFGDTGLLYESDPDLHVKTMDRDQWQHQDFHTTNQRDAGMRLVLPGAEGEVRTYYVRVRSTLAIGIVPGDRIADGMQFTVTNGEGTRITFEFDNPDDQPGYVLGLSDPGSGAVQIDVSDADTAAQVAQEVADAINNRLSVTNPAIDPAVGVDATVVDLGGGEYKVRLDGYHVQFNPSTSPLDNLANTSGTYQLQVRLREKQEVPGSTVRYADIRYATNGIEVKGFPVNSPLLAETGEAGDASNTLTSAGGQIGDLAQDIGNLLASNNNTIALDGYLNGRRDVDWYTFRVDYDGIQSVPGLPGSDSGNVFPVTIDVDYANGMGRADVKVSIYDSAGRLILYSDQSHVADDLPDQSGDSDLDDLSRGSMGVSDPYIGPVYLPEGTYYMAVTSTLATPEALNPATNPLVRVESIDSLERVADEHVEDYSSSYAHTPSNTQRLTLTPDEFTLSDVVMFVNDTNDLYTVDPLTGYRETDLTPDGRTGGTTTSPCETTAGCTPPPGA